MSASERTKGKRFEQKIAKALRELLPCEPVARGWQSHSGEHDPDVICGDLWLECKDRKEECSMEALTQAEAATDGRLPVAITKLPRRDPAVTLRLSTLMALVGPDLKPQMPGHLVVRLTWAGFLELLLARRCNRSASEAKES